jgi:hypothetical protein
MPRNINDRLAELSRRRKGTDRLDRLAPSFSAEVLAKSLQAEDWERRARTQPFTRYAVGAMQQVGARYTEISLETADRVGRQLATGLAYSMEFQVQGSVPLDVHIRGVSDVDLLALRTDYLTYAVYGARSRGGCYTSPSSLTSLDVLRELRRDAERVLRNAYPSAKVDCSGGKCIALSGGSLARPVDAVPSHWWDTIDHQASLQLHDRGVVIFDKNVPSTIDNLPFLHIKRVGDRDTAVLGGLKKAIRLTKNVKNDAENAAAAWLPSFDIAALLYHADATALRAGYSYELYILHETQRFLDWCYRNQDAARQLRTPDGTRAVLDSDRKFAGLLAISSEMDALAKEVAKEQLGAFAPSEPSWQIVDEALRKAVVPNAA